MVKLRESGMPEENYWEQLFDIELILDRLGIDATLGRVVELGCGYGTFTLPVARRISGPIHAYDIDREMVERTRTRARQANLGNVVCEQRDVWTAGFGGPAGAADACLLFNILHGEEPVRLLREAAAAVRGNGWVLVIHWRCSAETPRGPSLDIRPQPERILHWAERTGVLRPSGSVIDLPPWHYGLRLQKNAASAD